jgi:hypothetical protein
VQKETTLNIPIALVLLLVFQNVCIGIGAHMFRNSSDTLDLLTQIPTVFLLVCASGVVLIKIQSKSLFLFYGYCIMLIFYLFYKNANLSVGVVYLRNFIVFYLAYIVGAYCLDTDKKRVYFVNFMIKLSIVAGIFGIITLLGGAALFNALGVREVYLAKHWGVLIAEGGLPGNFRTTFFSTRVARMASFYYEPVNISYLLNFSAALALISKKRITAVFLFTCGFLTFGKGGLLTSAIIVFAYFTHIFLGKLSIKKHRNFIISAIIFAGFIFLVNFIDTSVSSSFGTYNHFYGFFSGIPTILSNPFGFGLGSAGNIARSADLVEGYSFAESTISTMAYQIGIFGTVYFAILFLLPAKRIYANIVNQPNAKLRRLCILSVYIPFSLLLVSAFQENTVSPQVIVPFMLLVGAFSTIEKGNNVPNCIEKDIPTAT